MKADLAELSIDLSKYDGLIFDCDGTLVDSMNLHFECWIAATKPFDIEWTLELHHGFAGKPTTKICEELNLKFKTNMNPKEINRIKEGIFQDRIKEVAEIIPVTDLVRKFYRKILMGVASGGERNSVWESLKSLGLDGYFASVVTAQDVPRGKPEPDCFLKVASDLGVTPRKCLVFEDGALGIDAAKAAGMDAILIDPINKTPFAKFI